MTNNIIEDLATLTTIPEKTLFKLIQKVIYCICENVQEDILQEKDMSTLDLGFGTLYIKNANGDVKYKFIPSEALDKAIVETFEHKLNLLEDTLNNVLAKKIINAYKDLC